MGACTSKKKTLNLPDEMPNAPSLIQKSLSKSEWMIEIKKERIKYIDDNDEYKDEYDLFVKYLMYPQITSSFYISIIARLIRHFTSDIYAYLLYDTNNKQIVFDGVRLTISVHPINGYIYIADDYKIYKLNNSNNIDIIAKIPDYYNKTSDNYGNGKAIRISDLAFNCDGSALFCRFNDDMDNIYYIDYNNTNKPLDQRIIYNDVYDKMDNMDGLLKYNFNHHYLTNNWHAKWFNNLVFCPEESMKSIQFESIIYQPDFYLQYLWILTNTDENYGDIDPKLYKIPFKYLIKTKELTELNSKQSRTGYNNLSSFQFEFEREKIEKILCNLANFGEYIDISSILNLKRSVIAFDIDTYYGGIYIITRKFMLYRIESENINNKNNKKTQKIYKKSINFNVINYKNKQNDLVTVYVYSRYNFQCNKLSTRYILTVNKDSKMEDIRDQIAILKSNCDRNSLRFYILKNKVEIEINNDQDLENQSVNGIIPELQFKYLIGQQSNVNNDNKCFNHIFSVNNWKITHSVSLKKILPNGEPLGIYTVKYDSVTGRIIIADNYKIQALYM